MAYAAQIPSHQIADKGPGTFKMSEEDRKLLNEPFAVAVKNMGCDRDDLIVYAVKLMRCHERPVYASNLLLEVDGLEEMERKGKKLPPLEPKKWRPVDNYLSDGESDSEFESGDYHDATDGDMVQQNVMSADSKTDDLQTDCAEPDSHPDIRDRQLQRPLVENKEVIRDVHKTPSKADNSSPVENKIPLPVEKKKATSEATKENAPREAKRKIDNGKSTQSLKQKLQVLRSENKRLKERQLCRKCHTQPVSITFLPCGHYSYCYECGQTFNACPICRKTILADVRTFLA